MRHNSVPLPSVELINIESSNFSPLIEKCAVKVCYVSDEPNRNKSIITKEMAKTMAPSLRGAAIVGYFNNETQDYEGHNRELDFSEDQLVLKDVTRPYGFVDLNAKTWFQWFNDDGVEHEYLMTEAYLWTSQYPEAKRVIEKGNNQSMELDENSLRGSWTKDSKGKPQFFIINEAIISKLCILGEGVEPCFEGAGFVQAQFSFDDDFKQTMFEMMNELKEILSKGGTASVNEENIVEETVVEETPEVAFEEEAPVVEEIAVEEVVADTDSEVVDEILEEELEEDEEEIPEESETEPSEEYTELSQNYSALQADYAALQSELESLKSENAELKEFKEGIETKEKFALINSFYMLSDEDKKEVVDNVKNYSLDDIEAKLSVLCVRNKVSFSENTESNNTTFNLNSVDMNSGSELPEWIKAVKATAKNKN